MRSFRDRDYIETLEGLFFTVVGNVHPRDSVIAYLKYIPSPEGEWGSGNRRFKRALPYYTVPMLLDTISYLKQYSPYYVKFLEELGVEMSTVSTNRIREHYKPEERLQKIIEKPRDQLEGMVAELAKLITDEAGVFMSDLGVTGSILINIHRPFSDIDLVIYGKENALRVKEALLRLYHAPRKDISALPHNRLAELLERRQRLFHLSKRDAEIISSRKWNRGLFKGKEFSIHPVKKEHEVSEVFGEFKYKPLGLATIRGVVVDSRDSLFMPSRWRIEVLGFYEGNRVEGLTELCSYEGLYMGIVDEGEEFEARGKVEAVFKREGLSHYRLLIGSPEARGMDYVKPIP
ncbi:MAG: nucleotidyltransferase domain-containing protein [Candidatus Nezhaarchaeota archaeon]|nr:nucleotidyltransferase domain-containing protein [Candidatus Nezhaarchaeota archaeon]MCX8142443.1 nucleotidyltransferase domain-containing protein [Candidatus Nezhaarchaeota archaeon]MDW8050584.1 nucleotidyltransferase domain-containing protein [Nitrososphaerota archaeon]